jgi:hypothetical protein
MTTDSDNYTDTTDQNTGQPIRSSSAERGSAATGTGVSRRTFLGGVGAVGIGSLLGSPGLVPATPAAADSGNRTEKPNDRRRDAYRLRVQVARDTLLAGSQPTSHRTNGDHERYPDAIADFTKGLPHDDHGIVDREAYATLQRALGEGDLAAFKSVPRGGQRRLAEPEAAHAFELVGVDPHSVPEKPAPAFASAETAAEMVELYWQALCRDVPFQEFSDSETVAAAVDDLDRLSEFTGPKTNGQVTSETVFRGLDQGNLEGPYLSQFLWQTITRGAIELTQKIRTGEPGVDYLTEYDEWLDNQRGATPAHEQRFDAEKRFIRNGRDLASYVQQDIPFQAYENAALLLLSMGALDPSLPHDEDDPTGGLLNFGPFDVLDAVINVFNCALSAAWYHKWVVNKRLRPEAFGGRVHDHRTGRASYPVHDDLLDSPVLDRVEEEFGTSLLPQAYPEGCPLHPSYPAGHAVIAGACITVLKAYFDESFVFENPVQATADGTALEPCVGEELTVGNELRKLASNMAIGRNWAGIHYRSDELSGLRIGEKVAISILRERKKLPLQSRKFEGFTLTTFDGEQIRI